MNSLETLLDRAESLLRCRVTVTSMDEAAWEPAVLELLADMKEARPDIRSFTAQATEAKPHPLETLLDRAFRIVTEFRTLHGFVPETPKDYERIGTLLNDSLRWVLDARGHRKGCQTFTQQEQVANKIMADLVTKFCETAGIPPAVLVGRIHDEYIFQTAAKAKVHAPKVVVSADKPIVERYEPLADEIPVGTPIKVNEAVTRLRTGQTPPEGS